MVKLFDGLAKVMDSKVKMPNGSVSATVSLPSSDSERVAVSESALR